MVSCKGLELQGRRFCPINDRKDHHVVIWLCMIVCVTFGWVCLCVFLFYTTVSMDTSTKRSKQGNLVGVSVRVYLCEKVCVRERERARERAQMFL